MSITARHKRPGAFKKLVQSLETTPLDRREKIYAALASEDAELVHHAKECIFTFEEFEKVSGPTIAEVMSALRQEIRTLAMALSKADQALVQRFVENMVPAQRSDYLVMAGEFEDISPRERLAARYRIITKARELEDRGRIILKKYSGSYPGSL